MSKKKRQKQHQKQHMIYTGPGVCYFCFTPFVPGKQFTRLCMGVESFDLCLKCASELKAEHSNIVDLGHQGYGVPH